MRKGVCLYILAGLFILSVPGLSCASQVIQWNDAYKYPGRYVIVEGQIVSTQKSEEACYLNFHKTGERYLAAVILKHDYHKFLFRPEIHYQDKMVRVKGVIRENGVKREIILREPSQIAVVQGDSEKEMGTDLHKGQVEGESYLAKNVSYHERYSDEERMFLKSVLNVLGYETRVNQAAWDLKTDKAVRMYQWNNHLSTDGRVGPKTLDRLAESIAASWALDKDTKSEIKLKLYLLASKDSNELKGQPYPIIRLNMPSSSENYYYITDKTQVGDEVEWYDHESGKYLSGEVESVSGEEVKIYDYATGKYHYVDISLTPVKKCRILPVEDIDRLK